MKGEVINWIKTSYFLVYLDKECRNYDNLLTELNYFKKLDDDSFNSFIHNLKSNKTLLYWFINIWNRKCSDLSDEKHNEAIVQLEKPLNFAIKSIADNLKAEPKKESLTVIKVYAEIWKRNPYLLLASTSLNLIAINTFAYMFAAISDPNTDDKYKIFLYAALTHITNLSNNYSIKK
jgi:hypothetical protein